MLIDIALALLSLLVLCVAAVRQPTTITAPPGWHIHGVRPDDRYELLRAPTWPEPGRGPGCPTDNACTTAEPDIWVRGRVYCTGGKRAIAVSDRVVGCQP